MSMDLNAALGQFDAVEANLKRLETVWDEICGLIPEDLSFGLEPSSAAQYEELSRAFDELCTGLPAIKGYRIEEPPAPFNDIAQKRIDASEADEPGAYTLAHEYIFAPAGAIGEYRFKLGRERQKLVRERTQELIREIDENLTRLVAHVERTNVSIGEDPEWLTLRAGISEIERLVGSTVLRKGRWGHLARHMSFAQGCDAHDIAEHDWPSVREDIERALYSEHEPLPVAVDDLATLAASRPHGPVSTALEWQRLKPEDFERLIFNIIGDAHDYENPQWLTRTNAADRGRDLSVDRCVTDSLGGVSRRRVIIQCKHWTSASVAVKDLSETLAQMALWEPPPVDVLIVATSGRFTSDAVRWAEQHHEKRLQPALELWPESHLELLLAERGPLVTEFGLRG